MCRGALLPPAMANVSTGQEREEEVHVQRRWCKRATTGGRLDATALIVTMPALQCLGGLPGGQPQLVQLPQQPAGLNTRGAPSASTTLSVACCATQL